MNTPITTGELWIAVITISTITVTGLVTALRMSLKSRTSTTVITNGQGTKILEERLVGQTKLIDRMFAEQETRITRHSENFIRDLKIIGRRLDNHYQLIKELQGGVKHRANDSR